MPIVLQLRHDTFTDLRSQTDLAAAAATHELILIGAHHLVPEGRLSQLRLALAPRRMVALLVDDHMPAAERAVIEELLNDGVIPVILTTCEPAPPALTSWLDTASPMLQQVRVRQTAPDYEARVS